MANMEKMNSIQRMDQWQLRSTQEKLMVEQWWYDEYYCLMKEKKKMTQLFLMKPPSVNLLLILSCTLILVGLKVRFEYEEEEIQESQYLPL